jgi:hypothetical protein
MHNRAKLIMTALTAAVVLGALVGTATAQRFEITNTSIRATFPALRFLGTEPFGGTLEITCPVTMEGTFHSRTIAKEFERLLGYITRAIVNQNSCAEGGLTGVTILQERLPWHIRYESFTGTLPRITRINLRLVLAAFRTRALIFGIECLFQSTAASPARGFVERDITTGQALNLVAATETSIPRFEGPSSCPASGRFQGSGPIRLHSSSTTLVFILLI